MRRYTGNHGERPGLFTSGSPCRVTRWDRQKLAFLAIAIQELLKAHVPVARITLSTTQFEALGQALGIGLNLGLA
jgi:hypothetical protein